MAAQSLPDNNPILQEEGKGLNCVEQSEHLAQALTPYGFEQMQKKQQQQQQQQQLYPNQPQSPNQQPIPFSYQQDAEERLRQANMLAFTDKSIRNAFIRKVYSILTIQMVIVGFIVVLLYTNDKMHKFIKNTPYVTLAVILVNFATCLVLSCCQSVARAYPINFFFLFVFTLTNAILVGLIAIHYRLDTVLIAVGITALICFSLTVFAFQTSFDFTGYGLIICLILLVFTVVTIILSFFAPQRPVEIVIAGIGVLIFSFILVYDTQLMIGGEHTYAFTPEDYIFAALSLYLDIINIFLFVLQLVGSRQGEN